MILGIIQARMSSTRLPGKVLKEIRGVPILLMMIDRAKQATMIDDLMVATSTDKSDDVIVAFCRRWNIGCFRGSLNNVLDRFYKCTLNGAYYVPEHIVRLTADCPLIEPRIIDETIKHHLQGYFDFTYNHGFPDGLDVEVMTFGTLEWAWQEAKTDYDREHVTPFMRKNCNKIGIYRNSIDLSNLKMSVDTEEDFERISKIIDFCISPEGDICLTR